MPEVLAHDKLHEALAAEHRDHLDGNAVAANHDRRIRHDPADRRIAGADLLGDIDAAATDRESHLQPGLGKIALALGKLDRAERRKHRRRRETDK